MERKRMSESARAKRANDILTGKYKGTSLFPVKEGLESAIKYIKKNGLNVDVLENLSTEDMNKARELYASSDVKVKRSRKEIPVRKEDVEKEVKTDKDNDSVIESVNKVRLDSGRRFYTSLSQSERAAVEPREMYGKYVKWYTSHYNRNIKPLGRLEFDMLYRITDEPTSERQ